MLHRAGDREENEQVRYSRAFLVLCHQKLIVMAKVCPLYYAEGPSLEALWHPSLHSP
jgi:hypothetical protein